MPQKNVPCKFIVIFFAIPLLCAAVGRHYEMGKTTTLNTAAYASR